MQHIIAPTDFSTRSDLALRRAGLLARESGAELTLLHVIDDDRRDLTEVLRREAETFLTEQTRSVPELGGVRCRIVIATGEAFAGILDTANRSPSDLIVMGSHRKQILRDIFMGTTIERVIRTGPYPVLMVNTAAERPYRRVLAAVDFSEGAAHAIDTGLALGLIGEGSVTLLHAFTATARRSLELAGAPDEQIAAHVASERKRATDALLAFLARHQIHPRNWSFRVEEGGVLDAISRATETLNPDLVVIGTRGETGLAKMLLGSVADEVLRSLPVDVLAVPPAR